MLVLARPYQMVLAHAPAMDCAGMVLPGATVHMSAAAPRKPGAAPTATSHSIQASPASGAALVARGLCSSVSPGCAPQLPQNLWLCPRRSSGDVWPGSVSLSLKLT
jgi:hypothetical protein